MCWPNAQWASETGDTFEMARYCPVESANAPSRLRAMSLLFPFCYESNGERVNRQL